MKRRKKEPSDDTIAQRSKEVRLMQLDAKQIKQFDEEGWLFLPDCFSPGEVAALRSEAESIYALDRPQIWREKSGAPRTAFAAHTYNEAFALLGRHPRLIEPVEQLFGEKLYMHQFKINAKAKFDGDVWQWHQDYGTWARDDGMPEAKAMNISVFLDEVFTFNGPLMLIPKSHKHGVLAAGHDEATTSYPLWTLDHATVEKLVDEGGLVVPVGKPGGVLMVHGNLVHGSAVLAQDCLSDAQRRFQPHPQADQARVDRPSGLPADRALRRRRATALRAILQAGG
jgi:ectoine hydroxylase